MQLSNFFWLTSESQQPDSMIVVNTGGSQIASSPGTQKHSDMRSQLSWVSFWMQLSNFFWLTSESQQPPSVGAGVVLVVLVVVTLHSSSRLPPETNSHSSMRSHLSRVSFMLHLPLLLKL